MDLFRRSVEIIQAGQSPSGAYVACPNFPTYQYAWFRDGSYCAYAMDLAGERASAERFHAWAAEMINRREKVVRRALEKAARGDPLTDGDILHARYTLEGEDGPEVGWGNFQLDGIGTWLWALEQHAGLSTNPLPPEMIRAAGLAAGYLEALWPRPCYDCWEEFPKSVHPHTLAAIYGGLGAASRLDGCDRAAIQNAVRQAVLDRFVVDGHFVKFSGSPAVDASLLGLAVPYGLVSPEDNRMRATVRRIEKELVREDGTHRYAADSYYGGGAWILLSGWLGWVYGEAGNPARAGELRAWIEAQASPQGELPEQVPDQLNDPDLLAPWINRWGPPAVPLLWNHASYITLIKALEKGRSDPRPGEDQVGTETQEKP